MVPMPKTSAGLLIYRQHGEFGPDEDALVAARREFTEETGTVVPSPSRQPRFRDPCMSLAP
jgi:predicted NUDIX family NTP pyrophosphohydrolase